MTINDLLFGGYSMYEFREFCDDVLSAYYSDVESDSEDAMLLFGYYMDNGLEELLSEYPES